MHAYRRSPARPVILPGTTVLAEPAPAPPSPDGGWLVLEAIGGVVPDIRAAALVGRTLRRTLMSGYRRLGMGDEIPAFVSGHEHDGTLLRAPHLGIVPMAFAGFPHADGRLFGFALVPTAQTALRDVPGLRAAFEAIAKYDHGTERRVLKLKYLAQRKPMLLSPAGAASKRSLEPAPYLQPARVWASVTPIVLDRHLKRHDEAKVRELIARSCANVGLPRPRPGLHPSGQALRRRGRGAGMAAFRCAAVDPLACPGAAGQPLADACGDRLRARGRRPGHARGRALHRARTVPPLGRGGGMTLTAADFATYFEAVHDDPPFPWQQRLVEQLAHDNQWPDVLDVPTGAGKTAALDVAVFHLALQAESPERTAALRIVLVVDRRLVVDDAHRRARKIACFLRNAARAEPPGRAVVKEMARRLQRLAGDGGDPLVAVRLRGGAPLEDDWTRTPTAPTILCSTVDQVGSRLLFRGYGVSPRMRPVHAGPARRGQPDPAR